MVASRDFRHQASGSLASRDGHQLCTVLWPWHLAEILAGFAVEVEAMKLRSISRKKSKAKHPIQRPTWYSEYSLGMLQAILVCASLLSVESFTPIGCFVKERTCRTSLQSVVNEPKVGQSAFDEIHDEGNDLILDIDSIADTAVPSEGIDKFLNKALAESVKSVQDNFPPELLGDGNLNIMEDGTLKKEIVQIFEKASLDLKAALDEIRIEQEEFARESAKKSVAKTQAATKSDQARMDQAEDAMVQMISKVNRETAEVEQAVEQLRQAQNSMDSDPIMKVLGGGLVKQAALAGAILFTLRSGADTISMLGGDSVLAAPALIQGVLALVCAAYVFFS